MNLFALKEQLREAGILISFTGSFSHSIIEELGTAVKKHLESAQSQKTAMMDVFSVYIEAAQNVRNYAELRVAAGHADAQASIVVIASRLATCATVGDGSACSIRLYPFEKAASDCSLCPMFQ